MKTVGAVRWGRIAEGAEGCKRQCVAGAPSGMGAGGAASVRISSPNSSIFSVNPKTRLRVCEWEPWKA